MSGSLRSGRAFGTDASRQAAVGQVLLEIDRESGRAEIVLNRPEKHNALSVPMRYRLAELIADCENDDDVRVVVLRGNGPSFCSGNEINEDWGQRTPDKRRFTLTDATRYGTDMTYGRAAFTQAIHKCAKPTILQMHGYCAAAAYFMIATRCDLVIASEDARIGALEGRFLGPAGAVSHLHLNRILGTKAARRLGYTAEPISGAEAQALGLAHRAVPPAMLRETVLSVASDIAARNSASNQHLKARIRAAEAYLGVSGSAMTGLLLSHFLRAESDELDFWKEVRAGNVKKALDADKARASQATAKGGSL